MPNPLTPKRLAELRAITGRLLDDDDEEAQDRASWAFDELLAEVLRLRPVDAEDIEHAGLTWSHVDAWVEAQPDADDGQGVGTDGRPLTSWRRRERHDGPTWIYGLGGVRLYRGMPLESVVRGAASVCGRSPWVVMDEMMASGVKS